MITHDSKYFTDVFQSALYAPDPAAYIIAEQRMAEGEGISKQRFINELQKVYDALSFEYFHAVVKTIERNKLNRDSGIDEFHYSPGDGNELSFEEFQTGEDAARQRDENEAVESAAAFNLLAVFIFDALGAGDADADKPKKINVEPNYQKLKEYFKSSFWGMGAGGINHFDRFVYELERLKKTKTSAKYFAFVALMCYNSKQRNSRKFSTFEGWYREFCEMVGCKYGENYSKNKLREVPEDIKNLFAYLD